MKINQKVRFNNPVFVGQLILAILVPILAYMGLTLEDLTTWNKVGKVIFEAYRNPYVLMLVLVSVYNTITDPTVSGLSDSKQAMTYNKPRKNIKEEDK